MRGGVVCSRQRTASEVGIEIVVRRTKSGGGDRRHRASKVQEREAGARSVNQSMDALLSWCCLCKDPATSGWSRDGASIFYLSPRCLKDGSLASPYLHYGNARGGRKLDHPSDMPINPRIPDLRVGRCATIG